MLALIGHDDWIRGAEWANFGQYEILLEVGMAGTSFFFVCYIVLSQSEKRLEKLLGLHLEIRREHWGQEQDFLSRPKIMLTEALGSRHYCPLRHHLSGPELLIGW